MLTLHGSSVAKASVSDPLEFLGHHDKFFDILSNLISRSCFHVPFNDTQTDLIVFVRHVAILQIVRLVLNH